MHFSSFLALGAFVAAVAAHPGAHHQLDRKEITRRSSLSKRCEGSAAVMNKKRSLAARSNTTVTITTEAPYYETIQNDTCMLTPDVTTGPYIWPRSHILRQGMSESQGGVPLYLDIGVLDINTCEPIKGVLVDTLSPGTPFADLVASFNKTIGPGLDLHTGNSTFLRGMWPTDSNGMMEMKTVFPGFYVERTIHIHAQVHTNWVVGINGTIVSDNTISTGQIFFDEDLSEQIMALEPYVSHDTINRTTNAVDDIFAAESTAGYNPTMTVVPWDGRMWLMEWSLTSPWVLILLRHHKFSCSARFSSSM